MEENNNPSLNNNEANVQQNFVHNEHKNLRAFFVSFATSQEEARAIAEGKMSASGFIPLYAENEQVAVAFLQEEVKKGLIVVGFEPLEVLEMKTFMLRNIAEKNEINIQRQKMFDGRLLLLESNPVQIYSGPAPSATEQEITPEQVPSVEEKPTE